MQFTSSLDCAQKFLDRKMPIVPHVGDYIKFYDYEFEVSKVTHKFVGIGFETEVNLVITNYCYSGNVLIKEYFDLYFGD